GGALTWSADPAQAALSGASGKLQTGGSAVLTAAVDGKSRSITVNEPALKFPAPAAAPTVVSGDPVFSTEVSVVLGTAEPGGSIYYTLDGSTPTESSQLYSGPIVLKSTTTINAITIADNKE
ncbi:hypothetical protein AMQ83_13915, partial [Paenibacillus riograndensis]